MEDSKFIRGRIPMTKSEIRAIVLSKLELSQESILYDIGAGTGSVAIEAALSMAHGQVYAIEQKEEGCELIRRNQKVLGAGNLRVIQGSAPEALKELPVPDRIFIGGSGGRLWEILDEMRKKSPRARIVLTVIALETLGTLGEYLRCRGLEAEIVSVQVARAEKLGNYHLMQGQNPVYIITIPGLKESGRREGQEQKPCCM